MKVEDHLESFENVSILHPELREAAFEIVQSWSRSDLDPSTLYLLEEKEEYLKANTSKADKEAFYKFIFEKFHELSSLEKIKLTEIAGIRHAIKYFKHRNKVIDVDLASYIRKEKAVFCYCCLKANRNQHAAYHREKHLHNFEPPSLPHFVDSPFEYPRLLTPA